ncbi:MAG: hypothetical protein E7448_02925 [Ruminococcaceae bacterium]|nr:hypothetical protein [Oscillospiraceae bacterium]
MSKVICDVCGTTYPETAAQCPICGSAKKSTAQTAAGGGDQAYAYVKGGRFSKSNVRKQNKKGQELERRPAGKRSPQKDKGNAVMIAIVILLVIAIIAVLGYMGVRVFLSGAVNNSQTNKPPISGPENPSTPTEVLCTGISLTRPAIEFTAEGQAYLVSYTLLPAGVTEQVTFSSSNPAVATVSETGLVTSVGGGSAIITITCGQAQTEFTVTCSFGDVTEPSDPTEPTVITPPGYELKLKYEEFTMSKTYPNPVSIYVSNPSVKATDITWTVDDPTIATVSEKGVVTAVGRGWTTIRASFGDQTASCKVIIAFDPEPPKEYKYTISKTDVTIKVGETFGLYLLDSDKVNVKVDWVASVDGYVEIKGNSIKGLKSTADVAGKCITISVTIDEETYKCTVRVIEPASEG